MPSKAQVSTTSAQRSSITPAISVLSALEGLEIGAPDLKL